MCIIDGVLSELEKLIKRCSAHCPQYGVVFSMAEADSDGMLLNLDVQEDVLQYKPTFKGGRWADRLRAAKVARYRQSKKVTSDTLSARDNRDGQQSPQRDAVNDVAELDSSGPAKRRRVEKDFDPAANGHAATTAAGPFRSKSHAKGMPREVISSLFSSNPTTISRRSNARDAIQAKPSNAPLADGISTFTNLGLSAMLSSHLLAKFSVQAPTSVQKVAIPHLINEDSDAFIQAETGSGKTLAYLLPIVQRVMQSSGQVNKSGLENDDQQVHRDSGLFAIVLAPTRELCKQISRVLETLLRCAHWIVAGAVLGGEKKKSEKARIRKGLNILVATPGRLVDHLDNTEALDVSDVRWLVLDEGDRLIEMGFEEEIEGIVSRLQERSRISDGRGSKATELPQRRVTILCSATMKMDVQRLGEMSLRDAIHLKADPLKDNTANNDGVEATSEKTVFSAPAQLKQSFVIVPAKLRLVTLAAVLKRAFFRKGSVMKAIVFISCADSVDYHFELFTRPQQRPKSENEIQKGSRAANEDAANSTIAPSMTLSSTENIVSMYKLHGSLQQQVRTSTLKAFAHSKDPSILICTDVASRGLDVPNVEFVIELDPPFSKDDHLHRIGRTARAGKAGRTLIFLLPGSEEGYIDILKEARHDDGQGVVQQDANDLLRQGFGSPGIGAGKDWEDKATDWQLDVERWLLSHPRYLEMARQAFQSHVRAYATHVATERAIFDIKALHLGHLAKSFALRDKPGNINVPGLRGGVTNDTTKRKDKQRGKRRNTEQSDGRPDDNQGSREFTTTDETEAAAVRKKMFKKMRDPTGGISEFNIG